MKLALTLGLIFSVFSAQATVINCPYTTKEEFLNLTKNYDVTLTIMENVKIDGDSAVFQNDKMLISMKQVSPSPRNIVKAPIKVKKIWYADPHQPSQISTGSVSFDFHEGSQLMDLEYFSKTENHAMNDIKKAYELILSCTPKKVQDVSFFLQEALNGQQCAQDA